MSVLTNAKFHLVESFSEVEAFRRWLGERRPVMGLDIETSGLSLAKDVIRLVQFGDGREGWSIPYDEWKGVIRDTLTTYEGSYVLQHAKFDAGFLLRDGLPFPWEKVHDTMLMCHLVDSQGPKGLKPAAALYVDPVARSGQDELKKAMAKHGWTWGTIPVDLPAYWGYAAADTILTALLAEKLWPRVQPFREAYDLELAAERVLCGMELRGMRIDLPYVEAQTEALRAEIDVARRRLGFNPNARAQVVDALQSEGHELAKLTPTKQLSVDDDVLSALDSPTARLVLDIRHKSKMLSSYFENFLEEQRHGRLHPQINQLRARTGRMSITRPALQTIPRESSVRDAFVPSDGNLMILADYDSQELRILAGLCQDRGMIDALLSGQDLHQATARIVYGEGAGAAERAVGKHGMYAKVYGAGAETLAYGLKITMSEARRVLDAINAAYPGIDPFMAAVTQTVRQRAGDHDYGYVTLEDGRQLKVPKDKAYSGLNYRIQGAGASVLKRALVNLDIAGLGEMMVLPVHDEIIFDVPEEDVDATLPVIVEAMERHDFEVPLLIGTKVVDRWGTAYRE